jgi:peptidoglycan/xylan/chitin deacetylase (PgdA/CDA1 family)
MKVNWRLAMASLLSGFRRWSRSGIVLSVDRVLPARKAEESLAPKTTLTGDAFERLLNYLQNEFRIVSLKELLSQPKDDGGPQRVAITFNHGWSHTYAYAYPLLVRYGVPATVFLCPGLMMEGQMLPEDRFVRIWRWCVAHQHVPQLLRDLRKWGLSGGDSSAIETWSRLLETLALNAKLLMLSHLENTYNVPACQERQFLNWDEVRAMRRNRITFGSHTAHHATLTAEHSPSLEEELTEARTTIGFQLQENVGFLAYPNGLYNKQVMEAAREAGYSHCFTTTPGTLRRKFDLFAIPRIRIGDLVVGNYRIPPHSSDAAGRQRIARGGNGFTG